MLDRFITPVLSALVALACLLAGSQWLRASHAKAEAARITGEFSAYRETQERNARQALQQQAADKARADHIRQEAQDAEHLARLAAQADADRLRASAGQLQRYAQDLAVSLANRAGEAAATPSSSPAASAAADLCPVMLGRLDEAAAGIAEFADASRRAGQFCERTHGALTD